MLAWRNHPDVRRASLTTHVIAPDEHRAWWSAALRDPSRRVLIYEWAGRAAGVVQFSRPDHGSRGAVWGFYLDVAGLRTTGQLLPAWLELERAAVAYAFDELGADRLGGETLAWNEQVLALHRRFGFRQTRRYVRHVGATPQEVVWTELTAQDYRRGAGRTGVAVGGRSA